MAVSDAERSLACEYVHLRYSDRAGLRGGLNVRSAHAAGAADPRFARKGACGPSCTVRKAEATSAPSAFPGRSRRTRWRRRARVRHVRLLGLVYRLVLPSTTPFGGDTWRMLEISSTPSATDPRDLDSPDPCLGGQVQPTLGHFSHARAILTQRHALGDVKTGRCLASVFDRSVQPVTHDRDIN